jgi:hypothetical protein
VNLTANKHGFNVSLKKACPLNNSMLSGQAFIFKRIFILKTRDLKHKSSHHKIQRQNGQGRNDHRAGGRR